MRYEFTIREGLVGRRELVHTPTGQFSPHCKGCGKMCGKVYTMCQHVKSYEYNMHTVPICGDCERTLEYWALRLCGIIDPVAWGQFVVLPKPSARMQNAIDEEAEIEAARRRAEKQAREAQS